MHHRGSRRFRRLAGAAAVLAAVLTLALAGGASARPAAAGRTATPIQHLVVIFQENVSFDHYFATYPQAANGDGVPFTSVPGTPAVDGLAPATDKSLPPALQHSTDLLTTNPNSARPLRLDSDSVGLQGDAGGLLTCDQDHDYSDEQQAFDGGKMDQFVQSVGTDGGSTTPFGTGCQAGTVMDYYDGNTVTGLWNYAQHFAMSDNSYGTTFGPSAPGAINLVSGNTGGIDTKLEAGNVTTNSATFHDGDIAADGNGGFSLTSDAQPFWDDCSTRDAVAFKGTNIGDELNAAGLTWGWFQGGFRPTTTFAAAATDTNHGGQPTATFIPDEFAAGFTGKVVPPHASNQGLCDAVSPVGEGLTPKGTGQWGFKDDYIPHHEPFQYYASTANPHHLTIAQNASGQDLVTGDDSLATIGHDTQTFNGGYGVDPQFDTPNHNYDISDFDQLVAAIGRGDLPASALPAVSFLKAPGYQDGHAAYSDPEDEQQFVTGEIDALMKTPDWASTAVIVSWDDSDGWYDHASSTIVNPSLSPADNLTNPTLGTISTTNQKSQQCGPSPQTSSPLGGEQGRCGFGPRLPLVVVSPCAKQNFVDHDLSDQTSAINFVEYNWGLPGIPGSFDQALTGTSDQAEHVPFDLAGMFDFDHCSNPATILDPTSGRVDLANAQLSGQNLRSSDFSGAILTGAALSGSNIDGGFFPNADLTGAALAGSNLNHADFAGATLARANLSGSNLNGADMTKANLAGASLGGANVHNVVWSGTTCPDGTNSSADGGTCAGHL